MKKIFSKIASLIIVLSILISSFCININAVEFTEPPFLSTYAAHYFHNLNSNFGTNIEGTCGYVAAAMLLSFYDSYWQDNFIPEQYDTIGAYNSNSLEILSSPGIRSELDLINSSGYTDYDNFIDDHADYYLHLKLLQIGRDSLGLCNPTLQDWIEYISGNPIETDWAISIWDVKNVINEYFAGLSGGGVSVKNNVTVKISSFLDADHITAEDPNALIRTEMIQKIRQGIPVIYFGYSESTNGGHFLIAYDYDEDNDEIYFHTGWSNNTQITNESNLFIYTSNTSILWFEFDEENLTHECTDAYVSGAAGNEICSCYIYNSIHPAHGYHNHLDRNYNDKYHWDECPCGEKGEYIYHTLTYSNPTNTVHHQSCTECDYESDYPHTYTEFVETSSTHHSEICVCGDIMENQPHVARVYTKYNNFKHNVYCKCGYYIGTSVHNMVTSGRYATCTDCGIKIDTFSDVTIKDIEEDTELQNN